MLFFKKKKDEERKISSKNYVILVIILVSTVLLGFYLFILDLEDSKDMNLHVPIYFWYFYIFL